MAKTPDDSSANDASVPVPRLLPYADIQGRIPINEGDSVVVLQIKMQAGLLMNHADPLAFHNARLAAIARTKIEEACMIMVRLANGDRF